MNHLCTRAQYIEVLYFCQDRCRTPITFSSYRMITWETSTKLTQRPALLVNFCRLGARQNRYRWPTTRRPSWSTGLTVMLTLSTDIHYIPTWAPWSTATRLTTVKILNSLRLTVTYSRSPFDDMGTAAATLPTFRPSDPAICGSCPLTYCCRLGICSVILVCCICLLFCVCMHMCILCFLCSLGCFPL